MAFWQFYWDFVREEVLAFFKEFHDHNCFVRSLNATFIALISTKGGTEELKDFRLISLVSGLYKWVSKVLAKRLKSVLGELISNTQHAFVEGRQIL